MLYNGPGGDKMWEKEIEKILKSPIFDKLNSIISPFFKVIKPIASAYFNELKNFQFQMGNPLFWVFFLIAVFFLNCFWKFKKAVIFCLTLSVILFITTALENSLGDMLSKSALFDYTILRYVSLFVILCVFLYFFFIRLD